ncbi:hypothetical protein E5161_03850 [Cohnella pontilimi]|uniref:AAA+ ATPase domain-containing protein n=1 Tax=Cohnella pontilimi TaxID=2564100 RepID=A0A4U0FHV4_9BACL|nr:ATPase, T2SS/T4P/T4SS family [Cohnella pontilimi]TJY44520.1 hypothetical protein E5161_03850 [Cohnella pontilimi]
MRIGELLIMNGWISNEQLNEALEEQRLHPAKLGEILIAKGFINEGQLVEVLEFQLGVPVVKLSETAFDPAAVHLIPDSVALKHRTLPIGKDGGKLRVAMIDPLNQEAIKEIQMVTGLRVQPLIAARSEMDEVLVRYYGEDDSREELAAILREGMKCQASAIRLEALSHGLSVRYRTTESHPDERTLDKSKQLALVARIKRMAGMRTENMPLPQSGRFQTDVDHKPVDVRVSTLPTRYGESLYLLLSDPYTPLLQFSESDLNENDRESVDRAIRQPSGLLLFAGPPGSGRTSLAYSVAQEIAKTGRKIISLENPIGRTMPNMMQVEICEHSGLTMSFALRAALRHRPDALLIDQIADAETAEHALLASRFGPLTLATITANGVFETLGRLMACVRDTELLATSLSMIVSQRLVRRVCRQCAQAVPATEEELRHFEANGILLSEESKQSAKGVIGNFRSFVSAQVSGKPAVTRGIGCRVCGNTGYHGLIAIHESLTIDNPLRERIAERMPIREIERHARLNGCKSLVSDGLGKAREGLTTVDEVMKSVTFTHFEGGNNSGIPVSGG